VGDERGSSCAAQVRVEWLREWWWGGCAGRGGWSERGEYLRECIYVAFGLVLLYSAFNSAASTLTLVFPTFGATNIMIIFFVFALASLFAPLAVAVLDPKWCIWISSVLLTFFIGMLLTGILGLVIFGSVLAGCASGLIWIGCGAYLGRSRRGSIANNAFWLIFFSSWLFGGVIGGILLNYLTVVAYQGMMLGLCAAGSIMLFFTRKLPPTATEVSDVSVAGLVRPLRLFGKGRMLVVLPTYLSRTTMLGFFFTVFPALVVNLQLLPYLTISTAICLTICGVMFVVAWDKVPALVWSCCLSLNHVVAMVLAALIQYGFIVGESRTIVLYVIAGAFGVSEAFGMSLASHYGATLFPDDSAGFFGCFRMCEGLSVGVIAVLATYTPLIVVISIVAFFAVVSVVCNVALAIWLRREIAKMTKTQNPIVTVNMPVEVGHKRGLFFGLRQATVWQNRPAS
jgi:hypothetical protein